MFVYSRSMFIEQLLILEKSYTKNKKQVVLRTIQYTCNKRKETLNIDSFLIANSHALS